MQRAWRRGRRASLEAAESDSSPGPGVVTAIREAPRRPGRYELEVGATTIGPITAEVIGSQGIRVGRVLDESTLHAVAAAELSRRGVASGTIATVVAELREGVGGNETAAIESAARRRMLGWLVRRGFPLGECLKVVRGLLPGR